MTADGPGTVDGADGTETEMAPQKCSDCNRSYRSKNALFKHLRDPSNPCGTDDADYIRSHGLNRDRYDEKIAVLYGYVPASEFLRVGVLRGGVGGDEGRGIVGDDGVDVGDGDGRGGIPVEGGDHASRLVLEAIRIVTSEGGGGGGDGGPSSSSSSSVQTSRSYGCAGRGSTAVEQDGGTGAVTEVLTVRVPALVIFGHEADLEGEEEERERRAIRGWVDAVNAHLDRMIRGGDGSDRPGDEDGDASAAATSDDNGTNGPGNDGGGHRGDGNGRVRVFGRLAVPKRFNAEIDATTRRVEYLLPVDFLFGRDDASVRDQLISTMPTFRAGTTNTKPPQATLDYMFGLKKTMQRLTTQVVALDVADESAVMEKRFHDIKRKKSRLQRQKREQRRWENRRKKKGGDEDEEKKNKTADNVDGGDDGNHGRRPDPATNGGETERCIRPEEDGVGAAVEVAATNDGDGDAAVAPPTPAAPSTAEVAAAPHPPQQRRQKATTTYVLRRKRYHNFTPGVMAHEFLAFRRLDKFHHRSTHRFHPPPPAPYPSPPPPPPIGDATPVDNAGVNVPSDDDEQQQQHHGLFFSLSMTGDMFLTGQALRVVGLFVAICRGYIDDDIIDCVFDERYAPLVPAPPAPPGGLYMSEARYMSWEGKTGLILSPRPCKGGGSASRRGWNDDRVLRDVEMWRDEVQGEIARAWFSGGVNGSTGRLVAEERWTEDVLRLWAARARVQLDEYREWKRETTREKCASPRSDDGDKSRPTVGGQNAALVPPLDSVDAAVPKLFQTVLKCLRDADASGLWPSTTPKRQLVMTSTAAVGEGGGDNGVAPPPPSLSQALVRARSNKEERSSAYAFVEGGGGASGSFSVGAMPGQQCEQPKGNTLFPELTRAAFELEIALRPDREPSSTIAVNRNAQFRPHTDSGAGAGQSTSLIVGLGTYAGGELVVEGEREDIRYRAIEFNGWTQRHWTLPFIGERYSLVWFTPKGCEGVRGIDLCN